MRLDQLDPMDATAVVPASTDNALAVFTNVAVFTPFLDRVRDEVFAFAEKADASTQQGRDAIKAFAKRVAKSRTHIETVGKKLADAQKDIPRKIDATRKHVRDQLELLEARAREPLTAWEETEQARISDHQRTIKMMQDALTMGHHSSSDLEKLAASIDAVAIDASCDEFMDEYTRAKSAAMSYLALAIKAAQTRETDAAELERLRALDAERQKHDLAADTAAATEQRIKQQEAARAEAVNAEQLRRESDRAHKAAVHRTAMTALIESGVPDDHARRVVELIALRKVPAVTITY